MNERGNQDYATGATTPPQIGLVARQDQYEAVTINKVENGFIVQVGCKNFVSNSLTEIFAGLELFYKSRSDAMKKYCKS